MNRHIDFEEIENFRDFGGYGVACGRVMKRGLLYRSAHHSRATERDLEAMAAMGIRVIVDLRRKGERERDPSRRWAGFDAQVIDNDLEAAHLDWSEHLQDSDLSEAWFRADSLGFYRQGPLEPRHIDLFSRYFKALATADGPLLVHCAAGKDRTGMICAFTHHIAGVHRDDLLADYLLTNDEARIARRAEFFVRWLRENTGREVLESAARAAMSVYPEYLEAAFASIGEAYGSLDAYLEQALGVDAHAREAINARLLG